MHAILLQWKIRMAQCEVSSVVSGVVTDEDTGMPYGKANIDKWNHIILVELMYCFAAPICLEIFSACIHSASVIIPGPSLVSILP